MIVVRVDRPGCGVVIAIVDNFDEFMSIRCAKSGMNKIGAPDQSIKLWGIDGPALVGQRVELNEQALIDRCSRGTK